MVWGVTLAAPSFAQPAQPAPQPAPPNQIQQLQNGLNGAIANVTGEIASEVAAVQSQLTSAISGLQSQLNALNPLGNISSQINQAKAAVVALLYRHGDPPWYIPPPEPAGTLCEQCCAAPEKVFAHQIRGTDPLGEDDLQKQITRDLTPLIVAKFAEVAGRISSYEIGKSSLSNNAREGQSNIKSIQSFQKKSATAILNSQASEQVCRIASVAQSLGASDLYARSIQMNMMDYVRDRQLLRENMNAGYRTSRTVRAEGAGDMGPASDLAGRWNQFQNVFCDPDNTALKDAGVCLNTVADRANRDIDFTKTVGNNRQLDIKIAPNAAQITKDSENIMALGNNLYASRLARGDVSGDGASERLMKQRSLYALRNAVTNSYAAFVAERASGTAKAAESIKALITELGGDPAIIGDRPSYETQMDALSRKLYQTPEFYKNVMEGDTNIKRQQVALQSIELMNKRDIYESLERSEMLTALWLEIKLRKKQDAIVNIKAGER